VKDVFLTEYNEQKTMAAFRDEYFEEGKLATLAELVKKGLLTLTQAASEADLTEEEFTAKTENI